MMTVIALFFHSSTLTDTYILHSLHSEGIITNSMQHSPSFPQLVKKFPVFYRTQRFITTFTTFCH